MATTKKSTKAKTKKPAAKTAAAKSTKVTKSTKAAKTNVKTPVTKKRSLGSLVKSTRTTTTSPLARLNMVSAAFSVILAIVAGVLMSERTYELVTGLLAKDELASRTGDVLVPAVHHLYDLELRWVVVAIMLVSAVIPVLALTRSKAKYAEGIKARVNMMRWVDMAIVSALMVETIALLSGVADVFVLKLIGGLMIITCALGWAAEKRNKQAGRPVWTEAAVSIVSGSLAWILIAGYAVGTVVYGRVQSPWYVYALYAVTLPIFVGYSMLLVNGIRRKNTNYEVTERNYLILSIVSKVAFAAILIAGLK